MAITNEDILSLQYSDDGTPFVHISTYVGADTGTLEYSLTGIPWYGTDASIAPASTNIGYVAFVSYAHIGYIAGVNINNINKVITVS